MIPEMDTTPIPENYIPYLSINHQSLELYIFLFYITSSSHIPIKIPYPLPPMQVSLQDFLLFKYAR